MVCFKKKPYHFAALIHWIQTPLLAATVPPASAALERVLLQHVVSPLAQCEGAPTQGSLHTVFFLLLVVQLAA